jgi:hypothetical protein
MLVERQALGDNAAEAFRRGDADPLDADQDCTSRAAGWVAEDRRSSSDNPGTSS